MDSPISALPVIGALGPNDLIPVVQGGVTSRATIQQFQQNLPISTAEQAALNTKAPLASPGFTGDVQTTGALISTVAAQHGLKQLGGLLSAGKYYSNLLVGYQAAVSQSGQVGYVYDSGTPANSYFHLTPYGAAEGSAFKLLNNGFMGLGTPNPSQYSHGGSAKLLEIFNSDTATNSQAHTILSTGATVASSAIGALSFAMPNVTAAGKLMSYISSESHSSHTSAVPASSLIFVTRNNGNLVEGMRLDAGSNLLVGITTGSQHTIMKSGSEGSTILLIGNNTGIATGAFYAVNAGGWNAGASALLVGKNSTTSRSISAGGTLNASGADYAEYMTKADACGTINKGAIIGVDASGKLVDKWADAVTFMTKSTDPSYVGGDTWGSEEALGMARPVEPAFEAPAYTGCQPPLEEAMAEDATDEEKAAYATAMAQYTVDQQVYHGAVATAQQQFDTITFPAYESSLASFEALLETARQKVDRIAFCGQVPINVLGATPGQYIIPVQDGAGIKGIAVSNPSFEQYMIAVGKVIAIEADGRARIIVKPV